LRFEVRTVVLLKIQVL